MGKRQAVVKNILKFLDKVEKILWEKVENTGYEHFLRFPTMFSNKLCLKIVKI